MCFQPILLKFTDFVIKGSIYRESRNRSIVKRKLDERHSYMTCPIEWPISMLYTFENSSSFSERAQNYCSFETFCKIAKGSTILHYFICDEFNFCQFTVLLLTDSF